jgi:hypothetical protein
MDLPEWLQRSRLNRIQGVLVDDQVKIFAQSSVLQAQYLIWSIYMWRVFDSISYPVLIFIAAFMLLAPFSPMPHVIEKLIMLKDGNLTRGVDIFDLCFHLAPTALLAIKFFRSRKQK